MATYFLKVSVFDNSRIFHRSTMWDGAIVHAIQMGFIGEVVQNKIDALIESGAMDERIERAAFEYLCNMAQNEIVTKFWTIEEE